MKKIIARFASKCAETKTTIKKYDLMYYDYSTKKCYSIHSTKAVEFEAQERENDATRSTSSYIEAQENAFYQNQYSR